MRDPDTVSSGWDEPSHPEDQPATDDMAGARDVTGERSDLIDVAGDADVADVIGETSDVTDEARDLGPATDPRIAAAVARLDALSDTPPAEHVEVYEQVHRVLQDALADATRGDGPEQPGGSRS